MDNIYKITPDGIEVSKFKEINQFYTCRQKCAACDLLWDETKTDIVRAVTLYDPNAEPKQAPKQKFICSGCLPEIQKQFESQNNDL